MEWYFWVVLQYVVVQYTVIIDMELATKWKISFLNFRVIFRKFRNLLKRLRLDQEEFRES